MEKLDVKVIGNLGDKNALDYGGLIVFELRTDNRLTIEGEYWPEPAEDDLYEISRFAIARDPIKDLNWVKEWSKIADFVGTSEANIRAMAKSTNPLERAEVYRIVGDYFGWVNIDSYPIVLKRKEMEERWPEFA